MSYTANPRDPNSHLSSDDPRVKAEPTGAIASDSLAAESLRRDGDFAATNQSAAPLAVPGNKSTLANTDTSGAVPLHPASSGAAREKQNAMGLGSDEKGAAGVKYPQGLGGQPDLPGTVTSESYRGAPSANRQSEGYSTGQAAGASDFGASTLQSRDSLRDVSSSEADAGGQKTTPSTAAGSSEAPAGVRPYVDAAPNYAARVSGAIDNEDKLKPKGQNLTEGDIPETKTHTGDVGGPHDPGRVAEQRFEKINASVAGGGVGVGGKEGETSVGGQYSVLDSERV